VRRPSRGLGQTADDTAAQDPDKQDPKKVEAAAVRLLARREHSTGELRRKLLSRGHAAEMVDPVLEKLGGKRLVSDDRYVASFVHHHARRGQGPIRIRAELRQQGIPHERIEQEFQSAGTDWRQLAAEVRRRKFGTARPRSRGERAKQARFLQYRGFDADQIRAALSFDPDVDDMGADAQLTDEAADSDPSEDPGST
jgi:regulatory protein